MEPINNSVLLSGRKLWVASVGAAGAAFLVWLVAILPAEFGRDPTGLGGKLGLTHISGSAVNGASKSVQTLELFDDAFRTAEQTVTLEARQGIEVKATMRAGQSVFFRWSTSGGVVNVDMHGEKFGAAEEDYSSFHRQQHIGISNGLFTAPFDGTHGWYWKNMNDGPVTITVMVSGYFSDFAVK